ncbi:MAG: OmpA family protein [Planctomycetes bacterium]|nr:OmpA family protein [Planctomycetota bacterium]
MARRVVGTFLLLAIFAGAGAAWFLFGPELLRRRREHQNEGTSDVGRFSAPVRLGGDGWLGYYALRSPAFKDALWRGGLKYSFTNDQGQYRERMKKLAQGEYDFVVATVDTYLLSAREEQYPGVIVAVIDESHGGDAIVAGGSIATLDDLAKPGVRIAVTPASPSDYLLKATAFHFNLEALKKPGAWRVETSGSEEALAKLRDGQVAAAVLWEPQTSRALKFPGCRKLLSTRDSANLIVDILIARRSLLKENEKLVQFVVKSYFQTLYQLRSDPARAREQAARDANETRDPKEPEIDGATAQSMLDGICFFGFRDDLRLWFGLGENAGFQEKRLALQVADTVQVLLDAKDLTEDPLRGDPFQILNSSVLESLAASGWTPGNVGGAEGESQGPAAPKALDDQGWARLRPVGHLASIPVYFGSGSDELSAQDRVQIDAQARILRHFPDYRIRIEGHSSPGSDPEADRQLSLARAEAIRRYLIANHHVDETRMRAAGFGADRPLPRKEGEGTRPWKARQQRVEMLLLEENF